MILWSCQRGLKLAYGSATDQGDGSMICIRTSTATSVREESYITNCDPERIAGRYIDFKRYSMWAFLLIVRQHRKHCFCDNSKQVEMGFLDSPIYLPRLLLCCLAAPEERERES